MDNLDKYRALEVRIKALPVSAKAEHALLTIELKTLSTKLSRLDKWKLTKGVS